MHYLRNIEIKIKTKIKQIWGLTEIAKLKFRSQRNPPVKPRQARPKITGNGCQSPTVRVTLKLGLGWYRHSVWSPTYRRAIKEVSKAVNLDWINNQACRLSQNIYLITNLFITNNYLFEMIRKIILPIILLNLYIMSKRRIAPRWDWRKYVWKIFLRLEWTLV